MLSPALHFRGDIIKKYKIISLILSFSVLMSVVIPFTSHAAYSNKASYIRSIQFCYTIDNSDYTQAFGNTEKLPHIVNDSDLPMPKDSVRWITFRFDPSDDFSVVAGDEIEFEINLYTNSRYLGFENVYFGSSKSNFTWNHSTGVLKGSVIARKALNSSTSIWVTLSEPKLDKDYSNTYLKVTSISYSSSAEFVEDQRNFFKKIGDWFNTVFEWLKSIRDNLSNGFANIGTWLTGLGDRISGFFTNLGNDIKTWFDNLVKDLKNLNAKIGQWFKDLTGSIGDFFTKLFNRLWWGNEDGEAAYQPPTINNKLNDILDILNNYRDQLNGTITNIDSSAVAVSDYISNGTALVNGVINVAGAGFTALITFGIVFVLVRKVVGR